MAVDAEVQAERAVRRVGWTIVAITVAFVAVVALILLIMWLA